MHTLTKKKVILCGVLTIGSIFFFIHRSCCYKPSIIESMASYVSYPLLQLAGALSWPIRSLTAWQQSHAAMQEKLARAYEENHRLTSQNNRLKALSLYAKKTNHLRSFLEQYDHDNAVIGSIFQKNISSLEHTILVRVGTSQGVSINNIATYCNQIVGRVIEVYPWYSKIMLITDHRSKIAGISEDGLIEGIVQGCATSNSLTLNYVSHLTPVSNNKLILSSGSGEIYPEGFALGTIADHRPDRLVHDIDLMPTIDLSSLTHCSIFLS